MIIMFLIKFEISFSFAKLNATQKTFTCSRSTIEKLEKGVIYVQNYQNDVTEQVNIFWECKKQQKNGICGDKMLNLDVI